MLIIVIYIEHRVKVILLGSCGILKEVGPITEVLKVRKDWLFHSISASGLLISNISRLFSKIAAGQAQHSSLQLGQHKHTLTNMQQKKAWILNILKSAKFWAIFFFSHCNYDICFKVVSIVFKLTFRNYSTLSKLVIQKE